MALALLSCAFVPASVLAATGALAWTSTWSSITSAAVALVAAVVARLVVGPRPRAAALLAHESLWLAVVFTVVAAPVSNGSWWAVSAGAAMVAALVVVVGRDLRAVYMGWVAWPATAVATLGAAHELGVAGGSLHLVLFVWGAAALIGGLAVDDWWSGRRPSGALVRRRSLVPPVLLGALAAPVALIPVYAEEPSVYGWWSLAAAAVVFVVAVQVHWGLLSAVGWGLTAVAYGALAPWTPVEQPWTLVPLVAVLVGVAEVFTHLPAPPALAQPEAGAPAVAPWPRWLQRWDTAPFLVAHLVAFVALGAALHYGWVPATWCGTGAVALVVAARMRAWPWAVAGDALILGGALAAGPGWLALALAATSVASTVAATRTSGSTRSVLRVAGVGAAGGAWVSLGVWLGWSLDRAVTVTALVAAGVALALAVGVRLVGLGREWLVAWAVLPVVGVGFGVWGLTSVEVGRWPAGPSVALGLLGVAVLAGVSAAPLGVAWLRETAALLVAGSGAALAYGVDASATQVAVAADGVGVVTVAAGMVARQRERLRVWARPGLLLGAVALSAALVSSWVAGPGWLALTLAVTSVVLTAVAVVTPGELGVLLRVAGVGAAGGAWVSLGVWLGWSLDRAVTVTALVAAGVALALAVGVRLVGLGREWLVAWAVLPVVGVGFGVWGLTSVEVGRWPAGPSVALGLLGVAVLAGVSAAPLGVAWLRETAALLVAGSGAALAYGVDASATQVAVAADGVGVVTVAAGMVARQRERLRVWARPGLLLGAVALSAALVSSWVAGPGWLALTLAVTSVVLTAVAVVTPGELGVLLRVAGVGAAGGAWVSLGVWLGWSLDRAVTVTALVAAGVALALAVGVRLVGLGREWLVAWAVLPVVGVGFGVWGLTSVEVGRWPAGPSVALGLLGVAVLAGVSAAPLGVAWLRETAALLVAGSGAALAYGADATATQAVLGATIVGVAGSLAAVAVASIERARVWRRPITVLATVAMAVSVGVAVSQWPQRPLLVLALLAVGFDFAAIGVGTDQPAFLVSSPIAIGAAWVVFASEALKGDPQWFTIPMGLTLLVIVGLARWERRRATLDPVIEPLVALDLLGMLLLVGSALIQTVTTSVAYGLVGLVLGLGLIGFGVLTRVRRRALFGVATFALSLVLMVVVPLVGLTPQFSGPALWLTIAAVGLVAIFVAAFLEQGRRVVNQAVTRLRELTTNWE